MLAAALEQMRADFLPDRMRPVQPDGIGPLDLNNPETSQAFDPKHRPRDFRQPPRLDRDAGSA